MYSLYHIAIRLRKQKDVLFDCNYHGEFFVAENTLDLFESASF